MIDGYPTRYSGVLAGETRNSGHVGSNHVIVTVIATGGQHYDLRDDLPCFDAVFSVTSDQTRKECV